MRGPIGAAGGKPVIARRVFKTPKFDQVKAINSIAQVNRIIDDPLSRNPRRLS